MLSRATVASLIKKKFTLVPSWPWSTRVEASSSLLRSLASLPETTIPLPAEPLRSIITFTSSKCDQTNAGSDHRSFHNNIQPAIMFSRQRRFFSSDDTAGGSANNNINSNANDNDNGSDGSAPNSNQSNWTRPSIRVTNDLIIYETPGDGSIQVKWADLFSVAVQVTSEGPFAHDVFWLLFHDDPLRTPSLRIPLDDELYGHQELMDALFSRLPGFNFDRFNEAMGCTEDRTFFCWFDAESNKLADIVGAPRSAEAAEEEEKQA